MSTILHYYQQESTDSDRTIPLFVIHTSPLDSNYLINSFPKELSSSLGVYFIDLPSHGKSPKMVSEELSFRNLADKIEELRKHLKIDQVALLGHGIGGFVAQYYATYHRKHTAALVISNSAPNHSYREKMAWNIRENYNNAIKQQFDNFEGSIDEDSLRLKFKTSLTYHFSPPSEKQAMNLIESVDVFAAEPYVIISNFLIPLFDFRQYNQKLKIPVMIIWGKSDVWPELIIDMFRTDIPKAEFVALETGHFPMIEKPTEFWNCIIEWITKLNLG